MIQPPARIGPRRPRWPWLAGWAVLLGVVVVVAVVGRGEPPPEADRDVVIATGPSPTPTPPAGRSRPAAVQAIPFVPGPLALAPGHGRIWVASGPAAAVSAVDPATGRIERVVAIPTGGVAAVGYPMVVYDGRPPIVAVAAGSVWATGLPLRMYVARIDPASGAVIAHVRLPLDPTGLLGDARGVWVLSEAGGLVRIDPQTHAVSRHVPLAPGPVHAAIGPTALWVSTGGNVLRIDPEDGRLLGRIRGGGGPIGIGGETVWVRSADRAATLVAIDEGSGAVVARTDVATSGLGRLAWSLPALEPAELADEVTRHAPNQGDFAVVGGTTWLARPDLGEVWRIDDG